MLKGKKILISSFLTIGACLGLIATFKTNSFITSLAGTSTVTYTHYTYRNPTMTSKGCGEFWYQCGKTSTDEDAWTVWEDELIPGSYIVEMGTCPQEIIDSWDEDDERITPCIYMPLTFSDNAMGSGDPDSHSTVIGCYDESAYAEISVSDVNSLISSGKTSISFSYMIYYATEETEGEGLIGTDKFLITANSTTTEYADATNNISIDLVQNTNIKLSFKGTNIMYYVLFLYGYSVK